MIKLNGVALNISYFPNGETKLDETQIIREVGKFNNVTMKYETDADLIRLSFLSFYLEELGVRSQLSLTYMPYSRMDRVKDNSAFTLRYVTNFINALKFDAVWVFEPHSDVTPALLYNCKTVFPSLELLEIAKAYMGFDDFKDVIYFPDVGAEKRYNGSVNAMYSLIGMKHRDFVTGKITNLNVAGSPPCKGKPFNAIIIDDLCSYGGTFALGATALKEMGAHTIYLVVTHAENSIYNGSLFSDCLIDRVFTTDSMIRASDGSMPFSRMSIYPLTNYGKLKETK